MLKEELKKHYSYKGSDIIQLEKEVNLFVPDDVLNKIKFLCKKIDDNEWSGVLFYSVQGTIKDPDNMVITLKDILPLDKGTKAATAYELDTRYIDYLMENEEACDWRVGHIHSHNTMSVYFSGVDISELEDNAPSHNYYLSMIVNNYMDFTAKIAFQGKTSIDIDQMPYFAQDEEGEEYIFQKKDFKIEKSFIYTYNCIIHANVETVSVDEDFANKVVGIIKKAEDDAKARSAKTTYGVNRFPNKTTSVIPASKIVANGKKSPQNLDDSVEALLITVLKSTNPPLANDTLDSVLQNIVFEDVTGGDIKGRFESYYVSAYGRYFEDSFPSIDDEALFVQVLDMSIEFLEQYETVFDFLSDTVMFLKGVKKNFILYATENEI